MIRTLSIGLACLALLAISGRAEAQTTAPECPPGQPCVVVVPQPPPAQPPPPPGTVVVQPQAQPGYVTVQPAQPQVSGYVTVQQVQPTQPVVYGAPQRQPVEVTRTRIRWGLVGPGIGLLIGGWVGNWITGIVGALDLAFSSSVNSGDYFGWSWVPVIGPWVNAGFFAGDPTRDGIFGAHILWGILQTGGLVMCILGTVLQEEVTEIQYVFGEDGPQLAVMPWADANGAGLSVALAGF